MQDASDMSMSPIRFMLEDDGSSLVGIRRAMLARIGREWNVGDRLPTIRELARQMAVSPTSVQFVVKELVGAGVLFSRKRLGMFVRALPDTQEGPSAEPTRPLEGKSIRMVVFGDPIFPFVQRMMTGFQQVMGEAGAETSLLTWLGDTAGTGVAGGTGGGEQLPEIQDCWGVAVFNPIGGFNVPVGYRNVTVVTTAEHTHAAMIARFDRISVDQYQGGMLAGWTLREAGCERACFLGRRVVVGAHRYDLTSSSRLHGFEHTWGEHLAAANLLYAPGYSVQAGAARFRDYMDLSPRPDAVFAASDELAVGFMAAATAAGLKAGTDYHLVGFDGQDSWGQSAGVRLSSVQVPALKMGQVAARMMIQRSSDPSRPIQCVALPCSPFVGATV